MRRLIVLLLVLVAALGGLWLWNGAEHARPIQPTAPATTTPDAPLVEPEPPATESATHQDAPEGQEQAGAAADAAADAAAIAADAAAEASSAAPSSQAAREAEAAAERAIDAADRAAEAAAHSDQAMRDTAVHAALLSPEGYDAAKVAALIDGLEIDPAQKQKLKDALVAAGQDGAALASALAAVRAALQ